jgi:hypothetical protein
VRRSFPLRLGLPAAAAVLLMPGVAACGGSATPAPAPTTVIPSVDDGADDARAALTAVAAKALDRSFTALYTLDRGDGADHQVVATVGTDGTWRVDVTGAVLGGTAGVSIVSTAAGVYQCTMSTAEQPLTPTCVKVANPGKAVPADDDPKVERLFRRWLTVFTDREAAIAVAEVQPLTGAQGTCFSIDSISASLQAPVDVGIYCYTDDGLLTAARVDYGVVTLQNQAAGPATVPLPGPEVQGQPMGTASPPAAPATEPSEGASGIPGT